MVGGSEINPIVAGTTVAESVAGPEMTASVTGNPLEAVATIGVSFVVSCGPGFSNVIVCAAFATTRVPVVAP